MFASGYRRKFILAFTLLFPLTLRGGNLSGPIILTLDATEISRQLLHAKIVAVNSRTFTPEKLEDAIRTSAQTGGVDLLVNSSDHFETLHLNYSGGPRSPTFNATLPSPT